MLDESNPIGWLDASGTPFEVGYAAGRKGQTAVHQHLLPSAFWANITDIKHAATVARLSANTQRRFPRIWQELEGLAAGLALPLQDVVAWNCRGDILAAVPDGCTTIVTPGETTSIAHNEDGLPFFRGHCFILNATPDSETGFKSFCYPGSLAGHTFGWNDVGLVQAVNNLRLNGVSPEIPRMVLARSVIASPSLDHAINILSNNSQCGGFHMSLAQAKSASVMSIEYGAGKFSVEPFDKRSCHTNHTLHLAHSDQTITASSRDRLHKGEQLLNDTTLDSLDILRDKSGPGLPIRRDDPLDPDQENTLATCLLNVSQDGITWKIYNAKGRPAALEGQQTIT